MKTLKAIIRFFTERFREEKAKEIMMTPEDYYRT